LPNYPLRNYTTYTAYSSYDDADRVLSVTHPSGEVVTYRYGDHGLPISLESSVKGKIVSSASYKPVTMLRSRPKLALPCDVYSTPQYW